jgi:hypothetical protein
MHRVVLVTNTGPAGILCSQEVLVTEFAVHSIVDIEEPLAERFSVGHCGHGQGLEFQVIVKGGATVLTR